MLSFRNETQPDMSARRGLIFALKWGTFRRRVSTLMGRFSRGTVPSGACEESGVNDNLMPHITECESNSLGKQVASILGLVCCLRVDRLHLEIRDTCFYSR